MPVLTDLHCHLLPYVDDGAETLDEALALLRMQQAQNVLTVVLTPHSREHMFETPPEDVQRQFVRLRAKAAADPGCSRVRLLLGREYHCDGAFRRLLAAGAVQTLGGGFLLIEFSPRHTPEEIARYTALVVSAGLRPVIAHAERYPCVQRQPQILEPLIEQGAWVQVNAGSLLGAEGLRQKLLSRRLVRSGLAHLVCSDAHDTRVRPPDLGPCAQKLARIAGPETAARILEQNPSAVTGPNNKECET